MTPPLAARVHIPGKDAYWCEDCRSFGNDSRECACCLSKAIMPAQTITDPQRLTPASGRATGATS